MIKRVALFWLTFPLLALLSTVPLLPCDSRQACGEVYRERMRIADLPGFPDPGALRSYAWRDGCGRCCWGARISMVRWLFDDDWNLRLLQSQRCGYCG